jgi:hypothetical protein
VQYHFCGLVSTTAEYMAAGPKLNSGWSVYTIGLYLNIKEIQRNKIENE